MKKKILCSICSQKIDVYTHIHKTHPFIDGKFYPIVCFTCFFVPKIEDQKYDKEGDISEEIDLQYCCKNINKPEDLYKQGATDSPKAAKVCVEAVKKICLSAKPNKKIIFRPKPEWKII
jgi:hypothetical protein